MDIFRTGRDGFGCAEIGWGDGAAWAALGDMVGRAERVERRRKEEGALLSVWEQRAVWCGTSVGVGRCCVWITRLLWTGP